MATITPDKRQRHVLTEHTSRIKKGRKIEALLSEYTPLKGKSLLDVGAGAGWIAHYFQEQGCKVTATDQTEELSVDVPFVQSKGRVLPFETASFDIVIYNHVIEHVGDRSEQMEHLQEIKRVLKRDGLLYLSVPNKWALIENHYNLPFLSWLPNKLASAYVNFFGKNDWYDCTPFGRQEMATFMGAAGFDTTELTKKALAYFIKHEIGTGPKALFAKILFGFDFMMPIIPTLIYLGHPK